MYCTVDTVRAVLDRRHEPYQDQVYPTTQVENAITLASYIIDAYCDRHFRDEPYVEEVMARLHPGYISPIFMVQHPVRVVVSLTDVSGNDVNYTYEGGRIFSVRTTAPVIVTYTSNDPALPCPPTVAAVCAEVAANILANMGEELTSVGTPGAMALASSGPYLTVSVRMMLAPYREI